MAKKTPASTSGFTSSALSDQGVRSNNEDVVHNDDDRGIYFVIDGMGGHAAGEQAAQIASERLRGRLERPTGTPQQRIREAIALANNAIFETAERHPDWRGMACVLTVAIVSDDTAIIGHVGDSRLYKIDAPSLNAMTFDKITRDHSPVGELEDSGQLSEAEAMAHPRRNEVFRDVGSTLHDPNDKDFVDIYETSAGPGTALLLCSDGLTDAVPLADIRKIIRDNVEDPAAAVQSLIRQAKKKDARDNISVVLVQGPAFGRAKGASAPLKELVVEVPQTSRPVLIAEPQPRWQRFIYPLLWLALGAALLFGLQQLSRFLPLETHRSPSTTSSRAPATIHVGAKQLDSRPTIAAALAVAVEGDTIELAPGIYDEPVRIEKSNILIDGSGALLRPRPTSEGSDGITITKAAGVRLQNLRIAGDSDGNLLTGIHIVDSQVTLRNVHVLNAAGPGIEAAGATTLKMDGSSVRDCSGPGLLLRGAISATVKYSAIVGNGRDSGDRQPGLMLESSLPVVLVGNTIANNGGPAIAQLELPTQDVLAQNLFSLEGRKGKLDDIRVTPKRTHK